MCIYIYIYIHMCVCTSTLDMKQLGAATARLKVWAASHA